MNLCAEDICIRRAHLKNFSFCCVKPVYSLHSLLDNNPLECDCGISPSLWIADVTGTCAYPPHLRGVEVSTLLIEDFKCG